VIQILNNNIQIETLQEENINLKEQVRIFKKKAKFIEKLIETSINIIQAETNSCHSCLVYQRCKDHNRLSKNCKHEIKNYIYIMLHQNLILIQIETKRNINIKDKKCIILLGG